MNKEQVLAALVCAGLTVDNVNAFNTYYDNYAIAFGPQEAVSTQRWITAKSYLERMLGLQLDLPIETIKGTTIN
jgi:hypothetical protein